MKVGQLFREHMAKQVTDGVSANTNVFLISYTKLSGLEVNTLRKDLHKVGAKMYVTRNSIIKHALKDSPAAPLTADLKGLTALVWGNGDIAKLSQVLVKFTKNFKGLSVQSGLLGGKALSPDEIKRISELPSREQLLAILLGTLASPISRFNGILNSKSRDLLSIMKQLSEKKGGS